MLYLRLSEVCIHSCLLSSLLFREGEIGRGGETEGGKEDHVRGEEESRN